MSDTAADEMQPSLPLPIVSTEANPDAPDVPEEGIALCISGGGYRAMLFHLGSFWRLNEANMLGHLNHISCVSGGSITTVTLGMNWESLEFDSNGHSTQFQKCVTDPIRRLAGRTLDVGAVLGGIVLPGSINDKVTNSYRTHLFGHKTLQDLPPHPRFVINATNVQTTALWRFTRAYMGDYRVGLAQNPDLELAVAVGASAAFPPVLSPAYLDVERFTFEPKQGSDLNHPPYTTDLMLTDGGVYDNMGIETAWKNYRTILVSDAGGKEALQEEPAHDWAQHSYRILGMIDNQVRSLRKRQVIGSYKFDPSDAVHLRNGAYWGIRSHIKDYHLPPGDFLDCPEDKTLELSLVATRLQRLDSKLQERLINWGYAITDAALRRHCSDLVLQKTGKPLEKGQFPYESVKV